MTRSVPMDFSGFRGAASDQHHDPDDDPTRFVAATSLGGRERRSGGAGKSDPQRNAKIGILDRLPLGVILSDERGHPRLMNHMAREIVWRDDGLTLCRGRLRAASPEDTLGLRKLVSDAGRGDDEQGSVGGGAMTLSRPSHARPLMVLVVPAAAEGLAPEEDGASVAIFVTDPERTSAPRNATLANLHGLTNAEARLVESLARGWSLEDIAVAHGISKETARTHLRRIYSKTGTHRQAELVSMVLRGPAVIRH